MRKRKIFETRQELEILEKGIKEVKQKLKQYTLQEANRYITCLDIYFDYNLVNIILEYIATSFYECSLEEEIPTGLKCWRCVSYQTGFDYNPKGSFSISNFQHEKHMTGMSRLIFDSKEDWLFGKYVNTFVDYGSRKGKEDCEIYVANCSTRIMEKIHDFENFYFRVQDWGNGIGFLTCLVHKYKKNYYGGLDYHESK